jgi:hypothetical protein
LIEASFKELKNGIVPTAFRSIGSIARSAIC